jgi:hypothetical protein
MALTTSLVGSQLQRIIESSASSGFQNIKQTINNGARTLASYIPGFNSQKRLANRHSTSSNTSASTSLVASKPTHASEGPSDLTKTSTLKSMMSNFKDIAVAILGGIIALAGVYLIFQSSIFFGLPLVLLGGYLVLRAYESWSDFHLLDTARMQHAIDVATQQNNVIQTEIVPQLQEVHNAIIESAESGKEQLDNVKENVETVSEDIIQARKQAEAMIAEIQHDTHEMEKVHHYTQEAIASLQECLEQIHELEEEGQAASEQFAMTLQAAQAIQEDSSKVEELKVKLRELEAIQQKNKTIFNSITLIRSQMSATVNGLKEIGESYFFYAEEFENDLKKKATELKALLEKAGSDISIVDNLVQHTFSTFEGIVEKALESDTLVQRTASCSNEVAQQLATIQDELNRYKQNLSKLQWICAIGGGVGGFLGAAFSGPLAAGAGAAVGARVAFPVYQLGTQAYGVYQWCRGTNCTKEKAA